MLIREVPVESIVEVEKEVIVITIVAVIKLRGDFIFKEVPIDKVIHASNLPMFFI